MQNIKRVSRYFRLLFQFIFILIPVLTIAGWVVAPLPLGMGGPLTGFDFNVIPPMIPILHPLSVSEKFIGFLVNLVPLCVHLAMLYYLIKLFSLYEQGKIFMIENVTAIKRSGIALLIYQLITPLYQAVLSPILTWHNPPGHRLSIATFNGTNFGLVVTAIMIILVSWVMAEGCKLKEEQQLTI